MPVLRICMLGRLAAYADGRTITGLEPRKVQELLCYLLLHRQRPHSRELLASLLWGDLSGAQARKAVRQSVWQLQVSFAALSPSPLIVEPEWVRVNQAADLWLDVAQLEEALADARGTPGKLLTAACARALAEAARLYAADLLEGCYQDWCLLERERLQRLYLASLDKLIDYHESHHGFEAALLYGTQILHYDYAHERTHRALMRLYHQMGDRTAALRQYARCVEALAAELSVEPARETTALFEAIRDDLALPHGGPLPPAPPTLAADRYADLLFHMSSLQGAVDQLRALIEQEPHPG